MIYLKIDKLITYYYQRDKDIRLIIFEFILQKAQIDTLYILFYK